MLEFKRTTIDIVVNSEWQYQKLKGGFLRTSSAQSNLNAIPCTHEKGSWFRL